jgi:hypothetical protein
LPTMHQIQSYILKTPQTTIAFYDDFDYPVFADRAGPLHVVITGTRRIFHPSWGQQIPFS